MRISLGYTLLATAAAVHAAAEDDTIGASVQNGVTELYGNSFGRPGYNVTYDYVVSMLIRKLADIA
jgi:choline dehydrogenase